MAVLTERSPDQRSADQVVEQRFATQRLTTTPLGDPVDVVRQLLCVQAQDAPLARYSVGLRASQSDDASVAAALSAGRVVRTHILRPTWHFVAAEDLRWLLSLTSSKVESSLSSRHRQLGVDARLIERVHHELAVMLEHRQFKTAKEVGDYLGLADPLVPGEPMPGGTVRHLLLVAELRGLVCSAPDHGGTHTYGLVDELIDPSPQLERDDAARQLVHRFFGGHGPASEQDLRRWTTLTLTEIRSALAELGDLLASVTCEGETLWFDPASVEADAEADAPRRRVALLPTFDEAFLPYRSVGLARISGHPRGEEPHAFAEAGGGVVILDRQDAGWWKRTNRGKKAMTIRLGLATSLKSEQRRLIANKATDLAAFFGREATVEFVDP